MNKQKAVTRTLESRDLESAQVALLVAAREEERKKLPVNSTTAWDRKWPLWRSR
jgi:hypothetical protein